MVVPSLYVFLHESSIFVAAAEACKRGPLRQVWLASAAHRKKADVADAGDEPTGVPRRCGGQVRPIRKVEGDGERTTSAAVVRAAPATHPVVGSTETREEETGESPTAECRNWAAEAGPRSTIEQATPMNKHDTSSGMNARERLEVHECEHEHEAFIGRSNRSSSFWVFFIYGKQRR
jgi:hypothetical protein